MSPHRYNYDRRKKPNPEAAQVLGKLDDRVHEWFCSQVLPIRRSDVGALVLFSVIDGLDRMTTSTTEPHSIALSLANRTMIIGFGWLLRCVLSVPTHHSDDPALLARSFGSRIDELQPFVLMSQDYASWRELVFIAKHGGYELSFPDANSVVFRDPPFFTGKRHHAYHILSEILLQQEDADTDSAPNFSNTFFRCEDIEDSVLPSKDFIKLWKHLEYIKRSLLVSGPEASSKAIVLSPCIQKCAFIEQLVSATKLPDSTVKKFIELLLLKSTTEPQFSLYHKPIVQLNQAWISFPVFIHGRQEVVMRRLYSHHLREAYDSWQPSCELDACRQLGEHLSTPNEIHKCASNYRFTRSDKTWVGEVDVSWYETETETLTLAEVKVIIPPDTYREFESANEEIDTGITQLHQHKEAFDNVGSDDFTMAIFGSALIVKNVRYILIPHGFVGNEFLQFPDWLDIIPMEYLLQRSMKKKGILVAESEFSELWKKLLNEETIAEPPLQASISLGDVEALFPVSRYIADVVQPL